MCLSVNEKLVFSPNAHTTLKKTSCQSKSFCVARENENESGGNPVKPGANPINAF